MGIEKICDRSPFAKEFGIANNVEHLTRSATLQHHPANPLAGADRDGALLDDDLVRVDVLGNGAGDVFDNGEIGFTRIRGRSADRNEYDGAGTDSILNGAREDEAISAMPCKQLRKKAFVNQGLTAIKCIYFRGVIVNARHTVANLREGRCCD
jgi:hypothetical protein